MASERTITNRISKAAGSIAAALTARIEKQRQRKEKQQLQRATRNTIFEQSTKEQQK